MTTPTAAPSSKTPRRLRAGGLAAVLVLGALWIGLLVLRSRAPEPAAFEPPPLPSPNGYDDVMAAARSIDSKPDVNGRKLPDFDALDTPALRAFVATHHDDLERVRLGLSRPFQTPVGADVDAMIDQMNEASLIRTVAARSLYAEAVLARRDGKPDEAMRTCFDLLRLGERLGRNVPMSPFLASYAPQNLGLANLRALRADLDAMALRKAVEFLRALDDAREPVAEVIAREHGFMDRNVRRMGVVGSTLYRAGGTLAKEKARVASQLAQGDRDAAARRRVLLGDLAVRLYHKEHGEYPASLDAIKPPLSPDPFSAAGDPLTYRKAADGYVLYSVGPDGDDDGLDPTLGKQYAPMSDGDLTVDSL